VRRGRLAVRSLPRKEGQPDDKQQGSAQCTHARSPPAQGSVPPVSPVHGACPRSGPDPPLTAGWATAPILATPVNGGDLSRHVPVTRPQGRAYTAARPSPVNGADGLGRGLLDPYPRDVTVANRGWAPLTVAGAGGRLS